MPIEAKMTLCDGCKSNFLQTKPYRKDSFTAPEDSFKIKTTSVNLCEDCAKTAKREGLSGLRRFNRAQQLLDGADDQSEDEEEE